MSIVRIMMIEIEFLLFSFCSTSYQPRGVHTRNFLPKVQLIVCHTDCHLGHVTCSTQYYTTLRSSFCVILYCWTSSHSKVHETKAKSWCIFRTTPRNNLYLFGNRLTLHHTTKFLSAFFTYGISLI